MLGSAGTRDARNMTDPAKTSRPPPPTTRRAPSTSSRTSRSPRTRHPCWSLGGRGAGVLPRLSRPRTTCATRCRPARRVDLGARQRTCFGARCRAPVSGLENRYVRVRRDCPIARARSRSTPRGPGCSRQFFRVLGTGDRLFLHRRENPLPAARAEADVFEGRLIRVRRAVVRRLDPRLLRHARDGDALLRARGLRARARRTPPRRRRWRCVDSQRRPRGARGRARRSPSTSPQPDQVRIGLPRDTLRDRGRRARRASSRAAARSVGARRASRRSAAAAAPSGPAVGDAPPPPRALDLRGRASRRPARRRRSTSIGDLDPGRRDPRRAPDGQGARSSDARRRRRRAARQFARPGGARATARRRPRSPPSARWRRW